MEPVSDNRPLAPAEDEALNRTVKQLEFWQLLRGAFPLCFVGFGVAGLYGWVGFLDEHTRVFLVGVPLALAGSVSAIVGYVGRLREIRRPGEPTTQHYPWLFIGWALVVAGLFIPPVLAR